MNSASTGPPIEALARQVVQLKRLVVGAFALAIVAFAVAATPVLHDALRDKIETREIAIRDDDGRIRARLNAIGLSIYDEGGKERLQALLGDGTASLILYARGDHRIHLAAAEDGHLGMYFFDTVVGDRFRLSVGAHGGVGFTLFDDHYTWRTTMTVTAENETSLTVFDKHGHPIWRAPPAPETGATAPSADAEAPAPARTATGEP